MFVPLVVLRGRWELNALMFAAGAIAYVFVLTRARVVSAGDLAELRRALGGSASAPAPGA